MDTTKIKPLLRVIYPETKYGWIVLAYAVFVGLLSLSTAWALQIFVNTVSWGSLIQPIFVLVFILFSVLLFSNIIDALQFYVVELLLRRQFLRITREFATTLPSLNSDEKNYLPEITNRYFEIVSLQKTLSVFLIDITALAIQLLFGMIIIATYHPFFLLFDILLILLVYFTLKHFFSLSLSQSIEKSKVKYRIASWLEDIARLPHLFRSKSGLHFSNTMANNLLEEYLDKRESYFRSIFTQHITFLLIYSVMSASLLGIGGSLVVSGQLTLGQLVAGELILTMILVGLSKIGRKLDTIYALLTSCDKILHVLQLPKIQSGDFDSTPLQAPATIELRNVSYKSKRVQFSIGPINLTVHPGERILITGASESGKSTLINMINGDLLPDTGYIELDGTDTRDYKLSDLRQNILLLRGLDFFFGTVINQINLYAPETPQQYIREVLESLGILDSISARKDGLKTKVQPTGYPLSRGERVRLILARGIVSKPRLLIIDELLDALDPKNEEKCIKTLVNKQFPWTLLVNSVSDKNKHLFERTLYFEKGLLVDEFRS